jgi:predicted RNA-binding Zn-ribbon protein involved in translation (DUF1610 family)
MDIRGERKCTACGARWSYYETGEIACPDCGSLRSVGVDERRTHTAGTATLDLTPVRLDIDAEPTRKLAGRASDLTREYVKTVGFIDAGELRPLSETYVGACELRRVGSTVSHLLRLDEEEELYFLELLRGVDSGERPAPDAVPTTFRPERGLSITAAVDAYLTDLRRVLGDREPGVDRVLSRVTAERKRIEALEGDVEPREAERLLDTVQDLGEYLRAGDETALTRALDRIDREES